MDEQILYTSLLKGANIGKLPYSNSFALKISDLASIHKQNIASYFPELLYYYGNLLEEEQEKELENLIISNNFSLIVSKLYELENIYVDYFTELILKEKNKIEIVFADVWKRTNLSIKDEDIKNIEIFGIEKNGSNLNKIWNNIKKFEKNAIEHLYKNTYKSVLNHIKINSGSEDESSDIWCKALSEFNLKLQKIPDEKGYFQWRPISDINNTKAKIITFFVHMCKMRWIDALRKKKSENETITKLINQLEPNEYGYWSLDENDEELKIHNAISKLSKTCQEIILGKWFGGEDGGAITFKELSKSTGLAIGTMQNYHRDCLGELGEILKSDKI